ncbi:hypothetical protein PISMIDRAFT_18596 [Pisolithus microcarpus 441]|uniref:Nucleoporin POM152 ninth Ig-like domain-containing protein n=1 Tax=Pisolithus microcarpus 441 TaxID=765257 RepID=A0A0C9XJZ7_9AGAM|nr:hypothetical protein PISMIDRAFT_18596 [Pisolithus microcarpus 441]
MVDPLHQSIWIDVSKTAAIIPLEKTKDFCVGDIIQFKLEGTPPWMISKTALFLQNVFTHHTTRLASIIMRIGLEGVTYILISP